MSFIRKLIIILSLSYTFLLLPLQQYAVYNPFSKPNNFIGIHILFPSELDSAARLVNSNGDWGYVTIPIQVGDKDLIKWQLFMDNCARLHIIPIIRLATESYYADTQVWRKPTVEDIVDFANFLNSLVWPTKNRYVILFNEVNRYDEWGGDPPNPLEYTQLVDFAVDAFKARNPDFFIILAGLDNAAPSDGVRYMNEFQYLSQIANFNSRIFDRIDGFASHSYPNPAFSAPPDDTKRMGVATYRFEYNYINGFAHSQKPVFITETGWDSSTLSEDTISNYYKQTLDKIWEVDKDKIVAITPFLLDGENSGFGKFSFYKNGAPRKFYTAIQAYPKVDGNPDKIVIVPTPVPTIQTRVLGLQSVKVASNKSNPIIAFAKSLVKTMLGVEN